MHPESKHGKSRRSNSDTGATAAFTELGGSERWFVQAGYCVFAVLALPQQGAAAL